MVNGVNVNEYTEIHTHIHTSTSKYFFSSKIPLLVLMTRLRKRLG